MRIAPTQPGWLPFTLEDVREQCAKWGDAPMAHPLPMRDQLRLVNAIEELRAQLDAIGATAPHWFMVRPGTDICMTCGLTEPANVAHEGPRR